MPISCPFINFCVQNTTYNRAEPEQGTRKEKKKQNKKKKKNFLYKSKCIKINLKFFKES